MQPRPRERMPPAEQSVPNPPRRKGERHGTDVPRAWPATPGEHRPGCPPLLAAEQFVAANTGEQ